MKVILAPRLLRFKAFVIDIFLIAMPLFYFVTYFILGSKEALWQNQIVISLIWLIYGIFNSFLIAKNAQTLGLRAYNLYLIDTKNSKKISFTKAFFRFLAFILAGFSIFGLLLCFVRKDKLNFQDLITNSAVVIKKS